MTTSTCSERLMEKMSTVHHVIFLIKDDMRIIRIESRKRDLNPRPTDLQSDALPTELLRDDCID